MIKCPYYIICSKGKNMPVRSSSNPFLVIELAGASNMKDTKILQGTQWWKHSLPAFEVHTILHEKQCVHASY